MVNPQIYSDEQLVDDLSKAIAQGVSGIVGAKPDPEDVVMARAFAEIINNDSLTNTVLEYCRLLAESKSSERL